MATVIPSTPNPTVISSVGPPLSNGNPTASLIPFQPSFITTLPTSVATTFGIPQSSNSVQTSLSPVTPSNSATTILSPAASSNNSGNSNDQSYPIGLIAGIVTGFSILMLVMGVLFVILWRHKRTKVISDSEASQMRGPRSAVPLYYRPPASASASALAQQQLKAIESGASTPVRSARFAPELEMMTQPPQRMAPSSPRRSGDLNKPWPPTPGNLEDGMARTSPRRLRQNDFIGGVDSGLATPPALPAMDYPGRANNLPDPLRADGLVPTATGLRAVHFTPSDTSLPQHQQTFVSQSPRSNVRKSYTHKDISPAFTIPDSRAAASRHITSNAEYEQTVERHLKRFSELTRANSTSHALSPPPRRPKTSDSEATESMGEGKLSRKPGLRLSGLSQGTVEANDEGKKESVDEAEVDQMLHRTTWYGEANSRGRAHNATSPRSGRRRFSQ